MDKSLEDKLKKIRKDDVTLRAVIIAPENATIDEPGETELTEPPPSS